MCGQIWRSIFHLNGDKMTQANNLKVLLAQDRCHVMPCCFDALSAKLITQERYELTFMSGFAASASRIGAPDLGLMSYGEVVDQARNINEAINIPMIADGDTGYGNAMNVRRTVTGMAKAGCASVMIEDQLAPKRCGHTPGKAVVERSEAFDRIRAAVDAREELRAQGNDVLILARTDARHEHGLGEAIFRAETFAKLGADILFVEAARVPGSGRLILTGQLGDVMKESAQAALSLVKTRAGELGIDPDSFEKSDIHVHVPAGAIPKDGPSAGVAMYAALASLLTRRKVRSDTAMTGEISLRGLVLPIGGVKEKVLAASRAGITTVLLPARNKKDIEDVPEAARKQVRFVWLERVDDALDAALAKMEPRADATDERTAASG